MGLEFKYLLEFLTKVLKKFNTSNLKYHNSQYLTHLNLEIKIISKLAK